MQIRFEGVTFRISYKSNLYSAIAVTLRRINVTLSCSSTKGNDQGKREAVKMNW